MSLVPTLHRVCGRRTRSPRPAPACHVASFGSQPQQFGWLFGAELQASSERFDDAANTDRLGNRGLLDGHVSKTPLPGLRLAARLANATDKKCASAQGNANAGRNAQMSLRWTLP